MNSIQPIDFYIGVAVNGIFVGLGTAIGQYIAHTHFLRKFEKIEKALRKKVRRK